MSPPVFSCDGVVVDDHGSNLIIAQGPQEKELHGDFSSSASPPDSDLFEEPSIILPKKKKLLHTQLNRLFLPVPNHHISKPSLASFKLLNRHGTGFRRLNQTQVAAQRSESPQVTKLSTHEIVCIAAERFISSFSEKKEPGDHFNLSSSGFSSQEMDDIKLLDSLLASVEEISKQSFEQAAISLFQCGLLSSNAGNPVQRLVYHFSEALCDRISQDSGKRSAFDFKDMKLHSQTNIRYYQKVPFNQVVQFAGVQAVVENVGSAKRIHIIDFSIRSGAQWTLLMAALKSRDSSSCLCVELLRITAVGCDTKSMQETGNWLTSFAETMKLPFSFKVITVPEILNLNEDEFELDPREKVVVHSIFFLFTLISKPDCLHHLMRLLRVVNPCIMVVAEVESNINSSSFMNRFVEALFYSSAYLDCLDACMGSEDAFRVEMESLISVGLKNIVATEGDERTVRHVKIDVWRAFFEHFGMEEKDLSSYSLYQANEMVKKVPCWSSCTLDTDGKCLVIGWKETPIHSLSLWKFIHQ